MTRQPLSYFWHKKLGRPFVMRVGLERKVRRPEMTVVFLHGIAAESDTYAVTLRQLAREPELSSVRLIALDLLGFGKSPKRKWLNYDYDEYVDSLLTTLKRLKVRGPLVLVGHSMGALIAAEFARRYSEKLVGVVLISPPLLLAEELARVPDMFYFKTYSKLHDVAEEPAVKMVAKFAEKLTSFRAKYLAGDAFSRSMEHVILNPKNYDTFVRIKVPTLMIHGRVDPLVYGPNLKRAAEENEYIKYVQVTADHQITINKRKKLAEFLVRQVKNLREEENETI